MNRTIQFFFFLFVITYTESTVSAQQVIMSGGRMVAAETLLNTFEKEEALQKIDSLMGISDPRNIENQLRLQLLKAITYDNNFEQGKALEILLEILNESISQNLHKITCEAYLRLASVSTKNNHLDDIAKYLKIAEKYIQKYNYEYLYSDFYYHKASWYRLQEK